MSIVRAISIFSCLIYAIFVTAPSYAANSYGNILTEKIKGEVIGIIPVKNRRIFIISSDPNKFNFDCHSCTSDLNLFLFEYNGDKYVLKRKFYNFTRWGSWGAVYASNIGSVFDAGQGKYLLTLHGGFTNQGITESYVAIFVIDGPYIKEIANFCQGIETGKSSWDAKYSMYELDGSLMLNIKVYKKGRVVSNNKFKLNGIEFIPIGKIDKKIGDITDLSTTPCGRSQ